MGRDRGRGSERTSARCRRVLQLAVAGGVLSALAVAPAGAAEGAPGHGGGHGPSLRAVSYNMHAGAGADEVFDLERQVRELRALDADVIGLQEVDVHWDQRSEWRDLAGELAEALDMYVYFAPIYSLDPAGAGEPRREYGVAVLSRHRILEAENHEITRLSTQDPDPVPAPAPGFGEVVLRVRGVPVHVYVTHLDYRPDPSIRVAQIADTRRIMAEDCDTRGRCPRQVLLGDFNAEPSAGELGPLWQELRDADPGAPTFPAAEPVKRIDYVAVGGGLGVSGAAVRGGVGSDHLPVVADLRVRRG
ncbi:Endonuclease/Exonuclease/phosphatase family protein [Streptomyces sp. YIM 130001]|uniref:endonuclease/exonuclease/phosphatase family protein n=1 Tax=Streptomyces sp. YIM 130001 TaxID=2259644 RepID=UPI000E64B2BD|nr:endonuclease/exonuclease/phosphatase family protein [Streptomyces sp. YIM 130001]RII11951.1 Endonuclease/Exonuclease/phosphatase family protein [Streptomyces sp. YIM 130001]